MEWTNTHQLPDRVIKVLKGKYKDKKPELNRISVTDLSDEPLIRKLYLAHFDSIVRDYSELLTMIQGTALHDRYERFAAKGADIEHKLEDAVSDIIVVGMADSYLDGVIMDIKQTGCYGPKYRIPKWTAQLNTYAWQRRMREEPVNKLVIDVWYRDWKLGNVFWKDYPQIPFETIELELWSFERQDDYVRRNVQKHKHYPTFATPEQYEFPCSNKQRGIRYEAYKGKNKTPTKVEDTEEELQKWIDNSYNSSIFTIRKSEPVFCRSYCKSRSVCPFMKEKK